jgi:hypothetical protein
MPGLVLLATLVTAAVAVLFVALSRVWRSFTDSVFGGIA